ncbi:MAG: NADH-quinone oxidoreductase subunit L [Gemmatimonadota bacterium]
MSEAYHPILPALILGLPLLGAALNGIGAFAWRENKTVPTIVGPLAVLGAFVVCLLNFAAMRAAAPHDPSLVPLWTWMRSGQLEIGVTLLFDQLSVLMTLIVTGVGGIIHVYSVGYMREDPGYSRYFSYLNLFIFFMLLLVLSANYPLMFVGWEGVGLCSYLLIGFWYENREFSDAGKKAFIVNRIGDIGFLIAMFLLFGVFGTLDMPTIFERAPTTLLAGGAVVTAITLFLFLGCVGKSAQIPLFVWLPDAMAGPTPVSALIHAATMVTAGVYLVARSGVLFALAPFTQAIVASVGVGTALFAASIAVQQYDIKKVLAYSTISQLGYMFVAVGVGAYTAGIFHLMTHAFFKALLFLGAGAVIHAMHHAWDESGDHGDPNDMRNYGGLRRLMPITAATMWIGTLAISGVFPFAGFFSKDEIIWEAGVRGYAVLWGTALIVALLTAGYMTRLMVMTFHGDNRSFAKVGGGEAGANRSGESARSRLHEVPPVMWVPLAILAALSAVGGWVQIPEVLPLPNLDLLHSWLEPVFAPAVDVASAASGAAAGGAHGEGMAHEAPLGGGEAFWAVMGTVLAILTIIVVFRRLSRRRYLPAAESSEPRGAASLLYHKWYVDELYDRLIVRPLLALWRGCWRIVDDRLIDGAVNGLGGVARVVGWTGSQLQTGRVSTYLLVFMIGVLIILGSLAF